MSHPRKRTGRSVEVRVLRRCADCELGCAMACAALRRALESARTSLVRSPLRRLCWELSVSGSMGVDTMGKICHYCCQADGPTLSTCKSSYAQTASALGKAVWSLWTTAIKLGRARGFGPQMSWRMSRLWRRSVTGAKPAGTPTLRFEKVGRTVDTKTAAYSHCSCVGSLPRSRISRYFAYGSPEESQASTATSRRSHPRRLFMSAERSAVEFGLVLRL
ncbi:hypothetical protein OBBRIDRAFT_426696 [Obba rivulosa]|uniref:Uncharacterized protein n=1 Tax=Obba rivulosa TaxID=1052685 RepID=A0A8E2AP62_9APHY|nr:hypothetical protein OBBRIDRAFT_426696 [Obba rivulosa]